MKAKIHTVILAALLLAAAPAAVAEKSHAQQEKFARCSHDSKGLKGEERNKFMSECLKAHDSHENDKPKAHTPREKAAGTVKEARHEAQPHETQQNRMKSCNEQAGRKDLHGDERRAFMSACLRTH